ncbi:MAG: hypothetical protein F6K19_31465 [Cyanothece sp. SIO1E1]|nr:hypothetical protein [Cyanothece sp. SIO1E1]
MWFALCIVGLCSVGLISLHLYRQLQKQVSLLSQKLQQQQYRADQVFSNIHNSPLQLLAFLMRDLQTRDVPSEDVLNDLQEIYTELQMAAYCLKED